MVGGVTAIGAGGIVETAVVVQNIVPICGKTNRVPRARSQKRRTSAKHMKRRQGLQNRVLLQRKVGKVHYQRRLSLLVDRPGRSHLVVLKQVLVVTNKRRKKDLGNSALVNPKELTRISLLPRLPHHLPRNNQNNQNILYNR